MKVWLRDSPEREAVGAMPDGVELNVIERARELPEGIREAEFLVPPYKGRRVLALLPEMARLRVIHTTSAGVEWLLPHVPEGVTVCNARGARDVPVAEWVLAVVLSDLKELPILRRQQEERLWRHRLPPELAGRRALIVGYGSIGAAVEERLAPFGVEIERIARRPRPGVLGAESLAERLPHADVVVVLVPASAETRALFDAEMLARLRPGALFVNAARGSVVDTEALVEVAHGGEVRFALDVTDPEPLPPEHPLWDLPNVTITPHLAGDGRAAERRTYALIGDQIRRCVAGDPLLNVIR